MQKTMLTLAFILCLLGFRNPTEEKIITGSVTDALSGQGLPGVTVSVKGITTGTTTHATGKYSIKLPAGKRILVFSFIGYTTQEVIIKDQKVVNVKLLPNGKALSEVIVLGYSTQSKIQIRGSVAGVQMSQSVRPQVAWENKAPAFNTEDYNSIQENIFLEARKNPLSTFSIDVDAASYSNVRRFLNNGQAPPKDAVRVKK